MCVGFSPTIFNNFCKSSKFEARHLLGQWTVKFKMLTIFLKKKEASFYNNFVSKTRPYHGHLHHEHRFFMHYFSDYMYKSTKFAFGFCRLNGNISELTYILYNLGHNRDQEGHDLMHFDIYVHVPISM